jgi:CheY-like chemotaxis protein
VTAASDGAGRGSTFTVRLPRSGVRPYPAYAPPQRAAGEAAPSAAPPRLDGVSVLLVDDEPEGLDVAARLLRARGAEVRTAASARAALAALAERVPDVLLSDLAMPEQDGMELIRTIRNLPDASASNVPAAAFTAYARDDDRAQAILAGYQAHLTKPFDPAQLVQLVDRLGRR